MDDFYRHPHRWHPYCKGGMKMTKRGQWVQWQTYTALLAHALALEKENAALRRQIGKGLHHV